MIIKDDKLSICYFSNMRTFHLCHGFSFISGPGKLLIIFLLMAEVVGCAANAPMQKTPDYFAVEYDSFIPRINKVALVLDLTPPEIESVDLGFTHGEGALHGAGGGALAGGA